MIEDVEQWGPCGCSSLDAPIATTTTDVRCPDPGTVKTVEGWIVCQRHAELIDECARIIARPAL